MEVMEAMLKRRSIRKFNDIPIPKDIIADMIAASISAPSAGNFQNCRLFVVDDEQIKDQISDACFRQSWMKSAPVYLVVFSSILEIEKMYGDRGKNMYSIQNAAAIAQNILLVATANGLGSCWVSAFNAEKIQQALNVPPEYSPQVVIPIGYPDEIVPKPTKICMRAFTYINTFGGGGRVNEIDFLLKDYAHFVEDHARKSAKHFRNTVKRVSELIYKKADHHINTFKRNQKAKSNAKMEYPEIKKDDSFKK